MHCIYTTEMAPDFNHLRFKECQQILVNLVLVRCAQTVRGTLVNLQRGAFDHFGLEPAGVTYRHNLVVITMYYERRHVDLLQVFDLISLGECLDAEICGREACHHSLQPE